MSLSIAISRFLLEFSELDGRFVANALSSLSDDAALLDQARRRLDLPARLTLLRRMAMVRQVDMAASASLDRIVERSLRLKDKHDELMRNDVAAAKDAHTTAGSNIPRVWIPTVEEVQACSEETIEIQQVLQSFTAELQNGYAVERAFLVAATDRHSPVIRGV